jgi:hypothetical protein
MSLDTAVDPNIIEPLSLEAAQSVDRKLRLHVELTNMHLSQAHQEIYQLRYYVDKAKRGNVDTTLGFPSWPAYIADVFKIKNLAAKKRRELGWWLSDQGLSQRVIGDVLGVDQSTVSRDLRDADASPEPVTGRDGKTYKRKPPRPAKRADGDDADLLNLFGAMLEQVFDHLDELTPRGKKKLLVMLRKSVLWLEEGGV